MNNKIQEKWLVSMYRKKDCEYSATDICMGDAQIWAKKHSEVQEEGIQNFKSFLGSALHKVIEETDEDGVIKELSYVKTLPNGIRIGGTTDELRFNSDTLLWKIGDVKLKGGFPMKKFLGIGTVKNPNPPVERDKEVLQMSLYRWLFNDMFKIEDKANIYLFTNGHMSYDKFPEYQTVEINLLPIDYIDKYIKRKIEAAEQIEQPVKDCPEWLCNYCDYQKVCKYSEMNNTEGFNDEQ